MNEFKNVTTIQELQEILMLRVKPLSFGIHGVSLFGSLARGEVPNDVDLIIHHYSSTEDLIRFKEILEEVCGLPVDIAIEEKMNPIIRHRALRDLVKVA